MTDRKNQTLGLPNNPTQDKDLLSVIHASYCDLPFRFTVGSGFLILGMAAISTLGYRDLLKAAWPPYSEYIINIDNGFALLLAVFFQFVLPYLERKQKNLLADLDTTMRCMALLDEPIENVISIKSSRFQDVLGQLQLGKNVKTAEDVFFALTQPKEQSKELLQSLRAVLITLARMVNKNSYNSVPKPKICLFVVNRMPDDEENKQTTASFLWGFPRKSAPKLQQFLYGQGSVGRSIESEDVDMVTDLSSDHKKDYSSRQYYKGVTDKELPKGCVCCYPIKGETLIELVLSIKYDEPEIINSNNIGLLKTTFLEPIGSRILLEYRLHLIRKHLESSKNNKEQQAYGNGENN